MRWVLRILFALVLLTGVVLGIIYPRATGNSDGEEISHWRIYEPGAAGRTVETALNVDGPVTIGVELRTDKALPGDFDPTSITAVVRDANDDVVLQEALALVGPPILESPQSRVQLYRTTAGILNAAGGTYRFGIDIGDDVRPSLLSVDLVLGAVAAPPDPRMQPAGFVLMAVGMVGFVLTFRRGRENPNSKPPKWGRV